MTAKIKLNAASGGGSVSLQAPTSTTNDANLEFKLPVADGTSGQALTTNASGQLAFASVAAGGANNISFNSGYGIDFSASSNAGGMTSELLHDYEEGTWTPALNVSATYSTQSGIYVKIGRLVHVEWALAFNSLSGTGYPYVGGLPYNVYDTGSNPIPHIRSQDAQPIELRQQPHTSYGNSDRIYVRGYDSSGNAWQPGGGTFWNNGNFNGTMTYYTAT